MPGQALNRHSRQVLERITDGFYALDRDFRFTYINTAAERILGQAREGLLNRNLWEAFPALIDTPLYAAYHEALATGQTITFEFYYPPFEHWIEVRVYPAPEGLSVSFRDISLSRRLTETLRESESRYRSLIDHVPAVIYVLANDERQTPLYLSPRHEALTGYSNEEAQERTGHWLELVHPDDRVRVAAENQHSVASGETFRAEYRFRRKDGSYVWIRDECVPVLDAAGQVTAWQGLMLDVTERVQADEHALRLVSVVNSSSEAILGVTLDGEITSWNPAAERLYGYTTADAIGQNVAMLTPPGREAEVAGLLNLVRQGEAIDGYETKRLTRDGQLIDVSLTISPVRDVSGDVVAVSSIARDVTRLRRAEAGLRLRDRALAATTNGIVIIDAAAPGNPIVDVNHAFETLTGYTRDEAVGHSARMLYGPDTDLAATQRIRKAIQSGNDITETLLTYCRDGTTFWCQHSIAAVHDPAGSLTHFIGVLTDVSERMRAEAALEQERDLLQTLLEHLPDAVYIKDTASRFLRLNHATARELGVSTVEEVVGKTDRDFFPAALAEEYMADERHLLTAGKAMVSKPERQTMSDDGRWVLATKVPLRDADGEIIGLVGTNRDITQLRQLQEERDRLYADLDAEFQRAAVVQALMLPQTAPEIAGYEFAGICLPARQVGGDFFDWTAEDTLVRLSLGDVMGKGMAAALQTAMVRASLRAVKYLSVSDVVETVNNALSPDLVQSDSFITLFHANLDTTSAVLTYVDAGHGMAFVQRQNGLVEPLRQHALPLGIVNDAIYPVGTTTLEPGDTVVVYSDGLPDARPDLQLDAAGVARQIGDLPDAQSKLERLVGLVSDIHSRPDDLTLVVLRRCEDVSTGDASGVSGVRTALTPESVSR